LVLLQDFLFCSHVVFNRKVRKGLRKVRKVKI
jgi:hypothetical protein